MKVELNESDNGFIIEFNPETLAEMNKLIRFTKGSVKRSFTIETTCYKDGHVSTWIQSKTYRNKPFGTIK